MRKEQKKINPATEALSPCRSKEGPSFSYFQVPKALRHKEICIDNREYLLCSFVPGKLCAFLKGDRLWEAINVLPFPFRLSPARKR